MKSILLVEDDPFLADIYTTKLKEAGFDVEVADEGEEALRKIKQNNLQKPERGEAERRVEMKANSERGKLHRQKTLWPDLLVLDIVLPRIDGWEILKEVKKDDKLKDLKVIILSNLGQKAEVDKGMTLGVIKYLIKAHYTPSEVVEEIKKIIK